MPTIDVRILDARLKDIGNAGGEYAPHYATPGAAGMDLRAGAVPYKASRKRGRRSANDRVLFSERRLDRINRNRPDNH